MCFLFLLLTVPAMSQSKLGALRHRVDSTLQAIRSKANYDTAYIARPEGRLTLKLRVNESGYSVESKGESSGVSYHSKLSTANRATVSLGFSYLGISAGLSLNPGKLSGKNKDYELQLHAFTNRLSLDASYQVSKTLSGDYWLGDRTEHLDRGMVDMKTLNIAGYYTFNHRRFSYPAAFTQSFIQKRSAGSWLAGFSYQANEMECPAYEDHGIPKTRLFVGNIAIGGGYGYNLVAKKWLFHLSAMPTLIVLNRNNITMNDERQKVGYHFPEMIFNHRLAVVYNIGPRYFLSATAVINLYTYQSSEEQLTQNKWYSRVCFGVRLF